MTHEYAIQRLVPPWCTNPVFPPPGQPFTDDRPSGRYRTREAAERSCENWEPGTWRVVQREVTDWVVA